MMRTAFLLLVVFVALDGCGNRGPLYLPPPADSDASKDASKPASKEAPKRPDASTTQRIAP